jgi:hypothetical protein
MKARWISFPGRGVRESSNGAGGLNEQKERMAGEVDRPGWLVENGRGRKRRNIRIKVRRAV